MKWWYLLCGYTQEYALVYARNEKEAFEKLMSKRKIDTRDYNQWEFEELKPDSYDAPMTTTPLPLPTRTGWTTTPCTWR